MRVLAVPGSLRPGSYNRMLIDAAARRLPRGAEMTVWDRLADLPAYGEHLDGAAPPPPVHALRVAIARSDALLIATPEYNHSVPGALKNALDWASRPYPGSVLERKRAAVIGASTGLFGAVWAQAEVRKALSASGAHVIDDELPVGQAAEAFAASGDLVDPQHTAALDLILDRLLLKRTSRAA